MVKASAAPKPLWPQVVWFAYLYAATLGVGAVAALMGLGGFDLAFINYTTPGLPLMTVTLAGLAIFSLPFLARLRLSVLARFFSALFAVVTPIILLGYIIYLITVQVIVLDWLVLGGSAFFVVFGIISFIAIGGNNALSFSRK